MMLRIVAAVLFAALLVMEYRIWASPGGMREVWRLEKAIEVQTQENQRLAERNRTLAAEVRDLKEGKQAIEERARTDLGLVKANEAFFQVVPPAHPDGDSGDAPPASGDQRTAQASTP